MPFLPPQDDVEAQLCAGIRTGAPTVSAVDRLTHVVDTSLPLPPTGEHKAVSGPSGTFPSPVCALCEHGEGKSTSTAARLLARVNGTLAHVFWA
jgi:hypothetical protein